MKKIMFNDKWGLTQAVLEGRKTMTRRIVPLSLYNQVDWKAVEEDGNYNSMVDGDEYYHDIRNCGRYRIGDVVAIAQSYEEINKEIKQQDANAARIFAEIFQDRAAWRNKMFVEAAKMSHHIKITNVRVERLQEISDDDILKEGVFQISTPICRHYNGIGYTFKGWTERDIECSSDTPKGAFKALIDKTCGRGTFESNPWCFCYEFELID